jgi:ABC-type phosphate/phosphonate transport system substrate-binding protein
VKSYATTVTAFRNNQVQLAWFGGLSGVRARALVPGSKALAQGAEDSAFADLRFDRAVFLILVTALLNIAVDINSRQIRARLRLQTRMERQ